MAEKKLTPSDMRKLAQQLIKSGKMPSPEDFAKAMAEERKDYAPALDKLRKEDTSEEEE